MTVFTSTPVCIALLMLSVAAMVLNARFGRWPWPGAIYQAIHTWVAAWQVFLLTK